MKNGFEGIEDGRLPDENIRASSKYGLIFSPHYARLNTVQGMISISLK